jgi:cell wall-associated NlpC family hydrolase
VERLPFRRHALGHPPLGHPPHRPGRVWQRAAALAVVAILGGVVLPGTVLPGAVAGAAPTDPMPSLQSLLAQAKALSNQINALDEQYNGLRVQLAQAQAESKVAEATYRQDLARLGVSKVTIGQLAAQSYMTGGLNTTLQLLTSGNPQNLLNRVAIVQQLQTENGDLVGQLAQAAAAAQRAKQTAAQQDRAITRLSGEMAVKQRAAQQKINVLNSAVFSQAMAVFNQTGKYPNFSLPTANTIGAQALQFALSRRGDPYVWGAAGPTAFDCSGLVMWAYQQVGISLPHYTGDQWNMGVHVSQADLQPGDLVFFYADISHVGLYIGNGLMVDAPDFGEVVQVQPIDWGVYAGAVRIIG